MARLELPDSADMTAQQTAVCDEAQAGKRGRVPAPMHAWIRNPELAMHAQRLGALLRYGTSLPGRLSEIAILVTARHWSAHFEWKVHAAEAIRAGVAPAHVQAIARREMPAYEHADEALVHRFSATLVAAQTIDDALYASACELLGETGVVDLVGILGYYGLVSMTLNVFEIGMPDAFQEDLA